MAAKIARQPNKIALLGSPTSAAAMSAGHEGAPGALRSAGLVDRLRSAGYEVTDLGDDPVQLFQIDEESPRARNVARVIQALEALKPRVEQALKSGALPLILSGDCSIALATIAGARRYFRHISMIYIDRDADLNIPATSPSGCVDGMVVSHVVGRGAAELVRFWGEPPLVREPDLALFGVARLDPAEQEVLDRTPLRRYLAADVQRLGPAAAAQVAIERIHGNGNEFILHLDVDVIDGFEATNYPGQGGLTLDQVREALAVFAKQKHLAAIEVTAYNPAKDPDGKGAKLIVDLLTEVLGERLKTLKAAAVPADVASAAPAGVSAESPAPAASSSEAQVPAVAPGQAWSSDMLETENESPGSDAGTPDGESTQTGVESDDTHSH
ncbi:MAG TPA: arginase family protein [Candidatus Cybelea sp.]|nr:arginase family protein [Candidatus Cybelea sp.]